MKYIICDKPGQINLKTKNIPRLKKFKPLYKVQWPPWIPELDTSKRFLNVASGLKKRGYKYKEIEKILGLNWLRYYSEVL